MLGMQPRRSYYYTFPICICLIFFCFLIAPARNLIAILTRYGKSGQSCLVPDFSGIALNFSPFCLMLDFGLLSIDFIMVGHVIDSEISSYQNGKVKNIDDSLCWRGCGVRTLLHCW